MPVPADMQGRSFLGMAKGDAPDTWRDALYYRYWMNRGHFNIPAHLGVRTKRYKLIYFYDSDVGPDGRALVNGARPGIREPFWELYDLDTDPQEVRNLYGTPSYAARAAHLTLRLRELRSEYGDDRDGLSF